MLAEVFEAQLPKNSKEPEYHGEQVFPVLLPLPVGSPNSQLSEELAGNHGLWS